MNIVRPNATSVVIEGHVVQFPSEVVTAIEFDDRVVVLLRNDAWSPADPEVSRNVFCYGGGGQLLWRIEPTGHVWRENGVLRSYYSYLALWRDAAGDELWAASLDWQFLIDKDTGKRIRAVHKY
jgi:hypothetical protein